MSYSIDIYRSGKRSEHSFKEIFLYISFFPQLVAGPIVRAKEFLPQLKINLSITKDTLNKGLFFILVGLIQKCFIADLLAFYHVDQILANPESASARDNLIAFYAFPFQLYNDFAGYSNMAIGSALLFGYKISDNFDAPYLTRAPADFWARWHISLSNWIRDYVFYPLLLSKTFKQQSMLCMFITMVMIGFWHGASWNFILFGVYHAILSLVYLKIHPWLNEVLKNQFLSTLHWVFFLHLVFFGFLIFRIENITDLNIVLDKIFLISDLSIEFKFKTYFVIWGLAISTHLIRATHFHKAAATFSTWSLSVRLIICLLVGVLITHTATLGYGHQAFIYFQF